MKSSKAEHMRRFRRSSMFGLLVLVYFSTSVFTFFANPKSAQAATANDIYTYNSLVGFGRFCGLDGGGDSSINIGDIDAVFDDNNGNNGNAVGGRGLGHSAEDAGDAIIRGFFDGSAQEKNGMGSCSDIVIRVVTRIIQSQNVALNIPTSQSAAKQRFASMLIYGKSATVDTPFPSGQDILIRLQSDAWQRFINTLLLPTIEQYKTEVEAVNDATVTELMLPALNFCWLWNEEGGQLQRSTAKGGDRLYEIASYKSAYWKDNGDGATGNGYIADLQLDYRGKPEPDNNPSRRWYSFGYASTRILTGVTGPENKYTGLLSCTEVEKNIATFMPHLQLDGESRKVKLTSAAEGEAGDIDTATPGGDGTGTNPGCDGGSLDWVICPITNGVAQLADGIVSNFLQPVLRAQILELPGSDDENSKALYGVWKSFRNLANATLILAFLVIIVSSAMSSE